MDSFSWVKRKEGWGELKWERNALQSSSLLNTANVSSTYRKYANGLLTTLKSFCSWWPTKMFAYAGPNGEPMATPSICRYVLLLKLNSTEEAALIRRRCHVEKMASVRRYCTGRRRRFVWLQQAERWWRGWKCQWNRGKQEGENLKFLTSTKVKESDTQLADRSWRTGWRGQVSHLASSCWADPVIDRIGRKDTSFLWVFGRPYMRSRLEPVGRMALYSVFEINFPWSVVATVVVSVFLF